MAGLATSTATLIIFATAVATFSLTCTASVLLALSHRTPHRHTHLSRSTVISARLRPLLANAEMRRPSGDTLVDTRSNQNGQKEGQQSSVGEMCPRFDVRLLVRMQALLDNVSQQLFAIFFLVTVTQAGGIQSSPLNATAHKALTFTCALALAIRAFMPLSVAFFVERARLSLRAKQNDPLCRLRGALVLALIVIVPSTILATACMLIGMAKGTRAGATSLLVVMPMTSLASIALLLPLMRHCLYLNTLRLNLVVIFTVTSLALPFLIMQMSDPINVSHGALYCLVLAVSVTGPALFVQDKFIDTTCQMRSPDDEVTGSGAALEDASIPVSFSNVGECREYHDDGFSATPNVPGAYRLDTRHRHSRRVQSVPYNREHWACRLSKGDRVVSTNGVLSRATNFFSPKPKLQLLSHTHDEHLHATAASTYQAESTESTYAHVTADRTTASKMIERMLQELDVAQEGLRIPEAMPAENGRRARSQANEGQTPLELDVMTAALLPALVPGIVIGPEVRIRDDEERTLYGQCDLLHSKLLSQPSDDLELASSDVDTNEDKARTADDTKPQDVRSKRRNGSQHANLLRRRRNTEPPLVQQVGQEGWEGDICDNRHSNSVSTLNGLGTHESEIRASLQPSPAAALPSQLSSSSDHELVIGTPPGFNSGLPCRHVAMRKGEDSHTEEEQGGFYTVGTDWRCVGEAEGLCASPKSKSPLHDSRGAANSCSDKAAQLTVQPHESTPVRTPSSSSTYRRRSLGSEMGLMRMQGNDLDEAESPPSFEAPNQLQITLDSPSPFQKEPRTNERSIESISGPAAEDDSMLSAEMTFERCKASSNEHVARRIIVIEMEEEVEPDGDKVEASEKRGYGQLEPYPADEDTKNRAFDTIIGTPDYEHDETRSNLPFEQFCPDDVKYLEPVEEVTEEPTIGDWSVGSVEKDGPSTQGDQERAESFLQSKEVSPQAMHCHHGARKSDSIDPQAWAQLHGLGTPSSVASSGSRFGWADVIASARPRAEHSACRQSRFAFGNDSLVCSPARLIGLSSPFWLASPTNLRLERILLSSQRHREMMRASSSNRRRSIQRVRASIEPSDLADETGWIDVQGQADDGSPAKQGRSKGWSRRLSKLTSLSKTSSRSSADAWTALSENADVQSGGSSAHAHRAASHKRRSSVTLSSIFGFVNRTGSEVTRKKANAGHLTGHTTAETIHTTLIEGSTGSQGEMDGNGSTQELAGEAGVPQTPPRSLHSSLGGCALNTPVKSVKSRSSTSMKAFDCSQSHQSTSSCRSRHSINTLRSSPGLHRRVKPSAGMTTFTSPSPSRLRGTTGRRRNNSVVHEQVMRLESRKDEQQRGCESPHRQERASRGYRVAIVERPGTFRLAGSAAGGAECRQARVDDEIGSSQTDIRSADEDFDWMDEGTQAQQTDGVSASPLRSRNASTPRSGSSPGKAACSEGKDRDEISVTARFGDEEKENSSLHAVHQAKPWADGRRDDRGTRSRRFAHRFAFSSRSGSISSMLTAANTTNDSSMSERSAVERSRRLGRRMDSVLGKSLDDKPSGPPCVVLRPPSNSSSIATQYLV